MVLTNIHILPICIFIWIPSSFIITYCIAVSLKHVEVGFPYISDTGTYVPESCIFSLAVNIISFSLTIFMYIQYKHVEQHYRDHLSSDYTIVLKLNKLSIVVGWLGCFGVMVLANFQETSVIVVHIIGALIAFGCATLYCWLQTVISHYACPLLNSVSVARLRVFLSLVLTVTFAITLIAGLISHMNFNGKDATKWHPNDGGFVEHVISTGAEWVLVIAFDFFILTYAVEMQNISISSPQIHFVTKDLTLQNREFYRSEDHINVLASQNSLHNMSNSESTRNNILTTQADVH